MVHDRYDLLTLNVMLPLWILVGLRGGEQRILVKPFPWQGSVFETASCAENIKVASLKQVWLLQLLVSRYVWGWWRRLRHVQGCAVHSCRQAPSHSFQLLALVAEREWSRCHTMRCLRSKWTETNLVFTQHQVFLLLQQPSRRCTTLTGFQSRDLLWRNRLIS